MTLPGFTAEMSLQRRRMDYVKISARPRQGDQAQVMPQVFVEFVDCVESAALQASVCKHIWIWYPD